MENITVWSLTARVAYKNETTKEVAVLKDFGPSRIVNTEDLQALGDIRREPAFKAFLTTMGYVPLTGTPPTTIKDFEFRFVAITTSGQSIHVAGSNKEMSPHIESDNLTATMALLNADDDFVNLIDSLIH
jgi:hypothetical protein